MRHPFSRIARLLLDQVLDLSANIRGTPITDIERNKIHEDFERVQDALARILATIPTEQILLLFPESRRPQVATMIAIARSLYEFMGKIGE